MTPKCRIIPGTGNKLLPRGVCSANVCLAQERGIISLAAPSGKWDLSAVPGGRLYCNLVKTKTSDAEMFVSHSWATQENTCSLLTQKVLCILQLSTQNTTQLQMSLSPALLCRQVLGRSPETWGDVTPDFFITRGDTPPDSFSLLYSKQGSALDLAFSDTQAATSVCTPIC